MKIFLMLYIFLSAALHSLQVAPCYIQEADLHASNQQILAQIIDRALDAQPPDPASHLLSNISHIARQLLNQGFSPAAYAVPSIDQDTEAAYQSFPLWEGASRSIPLTFFLYVWPSQETSALSPAHIHYATPIHSHPIPCALSVLHGTLLQQNYQLVDTARSVRLIGHEIFQPLQGAIDNLDHPFIHRICGTGANPAVSLHVYGLATKEEVWKSFRETKGQHVYKKVIGEN